MHKLLTIWEGLKWIKNQQYNALDIERTLVKMVFRKSISVHMTLNTQAIKQYKMA